MSLTSQMYWKALACAVGFELACGVLFVLLLAVAS